jgi:ParB/RepB/Spo0J family partition protein
MDRERDQEEFSYIVKSISDIGLKIPITVRPIKPKKKRKKELKKSRVKYYRYEIIKGHGRFNAVRRLGWDKINAFILDDVEEVDLIKMFLMENEVRKGMSAYERASLMEMDHKAGMTIKALARKYNLAEKTIIDNLATIESISAKTKRKLKRGDLSLDDAKSVSTFSRTEQDVILDQNLKSKELRTFTKKLNEEKRSHPQPSRVKVTRPMLIDKLIKTKNDLEYAQAELQKVNRLYLLSVANIRSLLRDPKISRVLSKNKFNVGHFK